MSVTNTAIGVSAIVSGRMGGIRTANGFITDIGQKVYRGRRKIDDNMVGSGCVSIIEGIDVIEDRPGRLPEAKITQRYALCAYVPFEDREPNDVALEAIADMKRAIFAGDATFGKQVLLVQYLGRDIGPREDGGNIVLALVEIGVQYVEQLTEP